MSVVGRINGKARCVVKRSKMNEALQQLHNFAVSVGHSADKASLLLKAVETAQALTGATYSSIGLVEGDVIHWQSAAGKPLAEVKGYRQPIGEGMCGWVVRKGRSRRSGDVASEADYLEQYAEMRSEIDAPLLHGNKVIGVLNAESPQKDAFTAEHEALLQLLADYVALALRWDKLTED